MGIEKGGLSPPFRTSIMSYCEQPTPKDKPLRLADAASHFPGLTVAALRREARKGTLEIYRVANKDWTTLAAIERMFQQCLVLTKAHTFGCARPEESRPGVSSRTPSGSSKIQDDKLALDAALASAKRLKESSRNTSPANTRRRDANVHFLKFAWRM